MIFIGFIYILFKVFWVAQGVLSLATRGYFAVKAVNILLSPSPPIPFPQALSFFQAILSHTSLHSEENPYLPEAVCSIVFGGSQRQVKVEVKRKSVNLSTQFGDTQDCLTFLSAKW